MRSFKTPNNEQITLFRQYAGTARFTYNWGLKKLQSLYKETKKFPSAYDLSKELRQLKSSEFSWLSEISKWVPEVALQNLERGLKRFLSDRKKTSNWKSQFPKFKSKKRSKSSFTLLGPLHVESNRIKVPKIGWLRLKEHDYIPTDRPIKSITISERAGRWFISALVEFEPQTLPTSSDVVGIDLGIKTLATLSDGTVYSNPKALIKAERKLKRTQREVSRRQKGSANRQKSVKKLAKQHFNISNIRSDLIHKMTTAITKRYGRNLIVADRFFASSKLCSQCGWKKTDLTLRDRIFECGGCGSVLDRDLNAAINLKNVAVGSTETINACEEESSGLNQVIQTKLSSVKQKPRSYGNVR